jgi:hypothetical protein
MKRGTCPKCHGQRIGRLSSVGDKGHFDRPGPRQIGRAATPGIFTENFEGHGQVEAYVCVGCGYFEEYVIDPASVPWEKLDGFQWVEVPKVPFR